MTRNKFLSIVAVILLPIVIISFTHNTSETNFRLENLPQEKTNEPITVKVLVNNNIEILDLEDYIIGVVAGEMPASFDTEALKAQAVASRSYALYKKNTSTSEYDLTDDTSTQVYITTDEMHEKWKDEFEKYYEKVKNAVLETKGEVAIYDGQIIEAFYFAMSNGQTQDSQSVFNETHDYLQKAESVYDNSSLNNYTVIKNLSLDEFKKTLNIDCNDIENFTLQRNSSNYVDYIYICNKKIKGTDFRFLLKLRSTDFTLDIGEDVSITTNGYGHGVGMSQYGANGYAKEGYTYRQILSHYYTGIEIINIYSE